MAGGRWHCGCPDSSFPSHLKHGTWRGKSIQSCRGSCLCGLPDEFTSLIRRRLGDMLVELPTSSPLITSPRAAGERTLWCLQTTAATEVWASGSGPWTRSPPHSVPGPRLASGPTAASNPLQADCMRELRHFLTTALLSRRSAVWSPSRPRSGGGKAVPVVSIVLIDNDSF